MASQLSVLPLSGFPLVREGDNLARLIVQLAPPAAVSSADVVVVTSKVVSKAEGRLVSLSGVRPSDRAQRLAKLTNKDPRLVELILQESSDVIRARHGVLIVRHRLGFVSASAGIDRSNIGADEDAALLLPLEPDVSAARIRGGLIALIGRPVAVIVSDSHGRAFRAGNIGVAIGVAGMPALVDLEGQPDLFGRPLTAASKFPLADLVATAAVLATGEGAQATPVALVAGVDIADTAAGLASDLVWPAAHDLFGIADDDYL